ncbi:type II toxin-antitoxin system ParD family antitoxin [Sphingomonas sp.]|uniref:ribbon-helix-helix domain-containing protein n=1 Tax=Sphingomonas sp. TaxID=28214 RepID=UPI0035C87031
MSQMTVSLSADLQGYVDARASAEGMSDPADFVLALLERDRRAYRQDVARVQKLIDEGIASGVCDQDAFEVLDEIMAELRAARG